MSSDSIIEKSVLAVAQLRGRDNWGIWSVSIAIALGETRDYVEGSKSSPPAEMNDEYTSWVTENCCAHQGIWLALGDDVKQAVLLHT